MVDLGRLFARAWRVLPRVHPGVLRAGFDAAALLAHARRGRGVRQLERNLHRVTGRRGRELRALSREGMRRYMRYYAEVFELPRLTPEQLRARVRVVNIEPTRGALERGAVVAALGHLGNWDLAGAWSEVAFAHVVTVAEKLQPEELFESFLAFREGLGMRILAFEPGRGVFAELLAAARTERALVPLLADRDLTRDGLVVQVCGHPMRVAPGPAALAYAAGVPFVGVFIRHEPLSGGRRRAAGHRWGIVLEFTDPLPHPPGPRAEATAAMMAAWAAEFGAFLRRHPEDWHMLQRCFVADLDAERLARAGRGALSEGA